MNLKKAALYTLGCKLNQFETIWLQEQLEKAGYTIVPFEQEANLYVINTCTVTSKADYHSRMRIRQARQGNPEALIIATGCSAQSDPGNLAKIKGVDLVIGNAEKQAIINYSQDLKKEDVPRIMVGNISSQTSFQAQPIDHFYGYTRAFLKVQDGCNQRCSYCIVPRVRGKSRSDRVDAVVEQARRLMENSYQEIVLTGIHLGAYGLDLEPRSALADLLESLLKEINERNNHDSICLRLSSVEPTEFTPRLKQIITQSPNICAHLHIPLQSGDDQILQRMRRPYNTYFYQALIEELVLAKPNLGIGADVLVGFPGETEESFQKTFRFIKDLPLAYLHVFNFSPRNGTEASKLPEQVNPGLKKERCSLLRELGREKFYRFRQQLLGTTLSSLVLGQKDRESHEPIALTENYIKVTVHEAETLLNYRVKVKITKVLPDKTAGEIVIF